MLAALAYRHPVSQFGTGEFRYQMGPSSSGTGLFPGSAFFFIPVPDWPDARPYCWFWIGHRDTLCHVHTTGGGNGYTLLVHVRNAGGGIGYTLRVPTAGGGNGYTLRPYC